MAFQLDPESVDIKEESTTPHSEGVEGRGVILHFNASRKLVLVFSFTFIFLSCLGDTQQLRNGLGTLRTVHFLFFLPS